MNKKIEMYVVMFGGIFFMLSTMLVIGMYFTGHESLVQNYINFLRYTCVTSLFIMFFRTKKLNYLLIILFVLIIPDIADTLKLLIHNIK